MENKHFVITVCLGNTNFRFECTTLNEAYAAIMDALQFLPPVYTDDYSSITKELDDAMEALVGLKNGTCQHYTGTRYNYGIRICDGEV